MSVKGAHMTRGQNKSPFPEVLAEMKKIFKYVPDTGLLYKITKS
jgi:hypothetical protein